MSHHIINQNINLRQRKIILRVGFTTLKNPTLYYFSTSSLILRVHYGFIYLSFYLTGFMAGSVGMQCNTIFASILGMSSYDHANISLNSFNSVTNSSFSEEVKVFPIWTILGSSLVPKLTD